MSQWIRCPTEEQQPPNSQQPPMKAHTEPLHMLLINFLPYFGCLHQLHVRNDNCPLKKTEFI